MDQNQEKMAKIKKFVFIGFIVSTILAVAAILVFGLFNAAGVFTIKTASGTKYQDGFTYQGWQNIYFGMGEMMIQGYTENTFDIFTCIGCFLPFLGCIVCTIIYINNFKKKGTNMKKAILEFVMAGFLIIGSILLFNCDKFWIANAQNVTGSYTNYYKEFLLPALNGEGGGSFTKTFYPTLVLLVGLVTALVKIANGALLIYQKKFAKQLKKTTEVK